MKNYKTPMCLILSLAMLLFLLSCCVGSAVIQTAREKSPLPVKPAEPGGLAGAAGSKAETYSDFFDDNGFFKGLKALDYIEKFNYTGMEIPSEAHYISNAQIQSEIDEIVSRFLYPGQIRDRAVAYGDAVNIDYVGSIDGVEFYGGTTGGMGTEVTAGSNAYIDDFLTQIIGHMPGETFDVIVTFPDDYPEESLKGKKAVFVTTINYIIEEHTDTEMVLTDDFVAKNLFKDYGWKTVEEMRAGLRSDMQRSNIQQYLDHYFATKVKIKSIPDLIMEYQVNTMLGLYQDYADYYGIELDELLGYEGLKSVDELIEAYNETNTAMAASLLVHIAIAEDAGLKVTGEDAAKYYKDNRNEDEYSSVVERFGLPYVKHVVLCWKVVDYIIENAILVPSLMASFPFTDVKEGDWFYSYVYNMWEYDLMNGTSATMFSPNMPLTRGMAVTVLWRIEGAPDMAALDMPFSDVDDDVWYCDAVKWAAAEGIINGYRDGTFRPNNTIYRQDLALILNRYADFGYIDLAAIREYLTFIDNDQIDLYAQDAVATLYMSGVINGKSGNSFDPKGNATRAEFAAMLHRIFAA
jgi:trigger factor